MAYRKITDGRPVRAATSGATSPELSYLFMWANLACCQMEDPDARPDKKMLPMEECFAIQFYRQLDDPMYVDELISNPTMAIGLLDYFANPSPNYRPEFAALGRAAVTKFLARESVFDVFLNSRDGPEQIFEIINVNLGPRQKFEILRAPGVVSTMLFHQCTDELTEMMNDLEPEMLERLLENETIYATIHRYVAGAPSEYSPRSAI